MLAEIDAFQQWLRRRSPHASTHLHYSNDLKLFFAWSNLPVEAITPGTIDRYITHCQSEGHAVATINRRLAAIQSLYTFLADEDPELVCPVLPHRHSLRQRQRLPRPVPTGDVEQFFAVIEDSHFDSAQCSRDQAMFLLMLRCGLRICEVAQLRLNDLYLDEVRPRLLIRGKNSKERSAYLSPQAEAALRHYLAERPAVPSEFVFLSYQLDGMSTTAIHKRLMRYREQAGIKLTAHQLRHTFANDLVLVDVPVTSIQKLLGHAWLVTTQTYVAANDRKVQADFYQASQQLEGWQ